MIVNFRAGDCSHGGRDLGGTGRISARPQPISRLENPGESKKDAV